MASLKLQQFLLKHLVQRGNTFTHSSLGKPTGAFYIPIDSSNEFFKLYKDVLEAGEEIHLTEKHRHISPILIDLDFRFNPKCGEQRQYTKEHVDNILQIYCHELSTLFDVKSFDMFVMEKSQPSLLKDKDGIPFLQKDGIHVVIPLLVSKPSAQYVLRDLVLPKLKPILVNMGVKNSVDDIVDEAVIERNNWLMYGSSKVDGEAYKVTRIVQWNTATNTMMDVQRDMNSSDLVELMSIRNKYDETLLKVSMFDKIQSYELLMEQRRKKMETAKQIITDTENATKNEVDNFQQVCDLVDILDPSRADDYNNWMRLGWCLRNIDHRLLPKWVEFSRNSRKYKAGECESLWRRMIVGVGLGVGSLHMWAKQDNLTRYQQIVRTDLRKLIYDSKDLAHTNVARVVHHMFKHEYVCASLKSKAWYEFKSHHWVPSDCAYSLRLHMSNDVWNEYATVAKELYDRFIQSEQTDERETLKTTADKLSQVARKLRDVNFKDNILRECAELFYIEKFEERLDSNPGLLGFTNGVYDLNTLEFREGRPEDYITFCTGNEYIPYNPTHPYIIGIKEYLAQVQVKPYMREYMMKLFGTFLHGAIKEQKFHIWTGSGCHAYDYPIMMYDTTFKCVQDIKVGEQLMGDNGTPRNVLQLFRGTGNMYQVETSNNSDFTVNEDHVLSLTVLNTVTITSNGYIWSVHWIEHDINTVLRKHVYYFNDQKNAEIFKQGLMSHPSLAVDGEVIDVTVSNYIHHLSSLGSVHLFLYKVNILQQTVEPLTFTIKEVCVDKFYGFELDGNHRYLDCHGIVHHNSNSKSKIIELFEKAFGDYCCKFPITLLTSKRAASNAATSELARAKGKRFASLQEPSEGEQINCGFMKELSGGDKIMARGIFKDPIEFLPQFKMILLCNHLPIIPSDDGGTWRRIRVLEFGSRFVDNPIEENEFPIDTELSTKLELWKAHFMSLLIEYYKLYRLEGIQEPEEVTACTREYKRQNDHLADFIHNCMEKKDSGFIGINEAFQELKVWVREDNIPIIKIPTKTELERYLIKALGMKVVVFNNTKGFKGWKLRDRHHFEGEE
jgi:P4 family phage/plasmid primase-like protien